MTKQLVLCPSSVNRRQQPLLATQPSTSGSRFGEVAGSTTAECAAVCCCCPISIVNLLICAVYKLPAGICRRAVRRKRRLQRIKKGLLPQRRRMCQCGYDDIEFQIRPVSAEELTEMESAKWDCESEKEVEALEKEMWETFYSTGFWRSPSQRETQSSGE